MADRCSLENKVNQDKVDFLMKEATELAKVISIVDMPVKSLDNISVKAVNTAEKLLSALFNDKDKLDLTNKTDEQKRVAVKVMDKITKELYRSMENPTDVMTQIDTTSRVYRTLVKAQKLGKVDVSLERFWWGLNRMFGNTPEDMRVSDVFGQRMNKYEQFEPSRVAFRLVNEIEEYTNKNVAKFSSLARTLLENTAQSTTLRAAGIDTVDKISGMFTFFDEGRAKQLQKEYNKPTKEEAFIEFGVRRGFRTLNSDNVSSVMTEFNELQRRFNRINYGEVDIDKLDNRQLLEQATPGSIVSFIRDLREKIDSMHKLMTDAGVSPIEMEQFNRVKKAIDSFVPRKNYVPYVGDKEDAMYSIFGNISDNDSIMLSSWLKHRADMVDQEGYTKGNFLDSLTMNLSATSIMSRELANKFFAKYLRKEVDTHSNWFYGSGERIAVRTAVEQGINMSESLSQHQTNEGVGLELVRSLSSLFGATILALPGSAIKNSLAGHVNMFWRLGSEVIGKDYRAALDSGDTVASHIDAYVNKYLKTTGVASEYTQNKSDYRAATANKMDQLRDGIMKAGDIMGDGMGIGSIFSLWRDNLTVKGTEEKLRDKLGSLMYNRIRDEMLMKSKSDLNKEEIISYVDRNVDDVFYDINNALGNYSALNKPFSTRALAESSDSFIGVTVGIMANLAYMFRHAGFVTMQNFMHSTADLVYHDKNPFATTKQKFNDVAKLGSVSGGLIIALYEILKRTVFSKNDNIPKVGSSLTSAINPLEEMDVIPKYALYLYLRAFNDEPLSDKDYALLKSEALNYTTGVLSMLGGGGSTKQSVNVQKSRLESEDFVNQIVNFPKAVASMVDIDKTYDTGYAAISEMRTASRNKDNSMYAVTSLDPFYLVTKAMELFTVQAPNDKAAEWKYRSELFASTVATSFAFKFWTENKLKPADYSFDNEFTKNTYLKYTSRTNNPRLPRPIVTIKNADYMLKYGTGKGKQVVPIY